MLGNDGGGHLLPSHVQLITTECEKSKGGSLTTLSRSRECRMNQMKNTCMHRVYSRHLCTLEVIRTQDPSVREVWRLIIWVRADTWGEDMTRVTCLPCDGSARQRGAFVKTRTKGSIFKRPKPDSVQNHLPVSDLIKITKMPYPLECYSCQLI